MRSEVLAPCVGDMDCAAPLVCISNVSWTASGCQCSPYYGWTGLPDCLELDTSALALRGVYATLAALALAALLGGAFALLRAVLTLNRMPRMDAATGTCTLVLLALAAHFAWFVTGATIFSRPGENTRWRANTQERIPQLAILEQGFIVSALVFGTASVLNTSLIWIRVVERARAFSSRRLSFLRRLRLVVYGTEIVYATLLVACFAAGVSEAAALVTLPFYVFIVSTYAFGQAKLVRLLRRVAELETTSPAHRTWCAQQERRVRRTARSILALLSGVLLCACVYAGLTLSAGGWMEFVGPSDSVGLLQGFYIGIPVGSLLVCLAVLRFAGASLLGRIYKHKKHGAASVRRSASERGGSGELDADEGERRPSEVAKV